MEQTKTLIYIASDTYYFQKTIILEKNSIRTINVSFDLTKSKGLNKLNQKREIKKAMKKVVSNNDVITSSTDLTSGDVIITTGGIILGDILPVFILSKAASKREKRKKEIAPYFLPGAYEENCCQAFDDNFGFMDTVLLDLCKELLVEGQEKESGIDIYLKLLDCLVEAPQPIKSSNYEQNIEIMKSEYQKRLKRETFLK